MFGDVIGFALGWERQQHGALWISGDAVLNDGVREVAGRVPVDVALLHLGSVRFGVSGPLRYTLTAREGVKLCRLISPRARVRARARRPRRAPSLRWLPLGTALEIDELG